ncbi:DUF3618 domain-containing protein [Marinimicrobium sp. C2-29]|uniref:DUF3618 domain-containing protein n=1 Tax=Marinimicrobium sp. C2-29 TaxID=3139825 RepID=UPI0031397FAE
MSNATDTRNDNRGQNHDQPDSGKHDSRKTPRQLEQEVDQARTRFGRTASELSDRLSPGELVDQAIGMAREHGGEFGRNLGSQVKSNPMPMILTSVGMSWLMLSSGKTGAAHDHNRHATSSSQNGRGVKDTLNDAAEKSQDAASAVGDGIQDTAENLRDSAQSARKSLMRFYRDQPLIAGSLGIAIGAALGALVPPTEMEDDMVGEASDHSVDVAKSKAAKEYDGVREHARTR